MLIFKNFGSKIHNIGSMAKLFHFASSHLLWLAFRELWEVTQSNYVFPLLNKLNINLDKKNKLIETRFLSGTWML